MSARTGRVDPHGRGWRLQVKIRGERVRKTFPTKAEAQAALAEILAQLERDASAELAAKIGPLTVQRVVETYYERRKPHLELSTQARYESVLRKYVYPQIGAIPANDIVATPIVLEDWLRTIPPGQARKAMEVIGPAFRMASDNGLIASDPTTKVRRPNKTDRKRKKEIPTPDDVEKIVIAAYEEGIWWGYFVELAAILGLRRGELCGLRWEDFDFPGPDDRYGTIHVRRAVGKRDGGIYIKPPKSGLERDLVVHRSLFEGLWDFDGEEGWLFAGRDLGTAARLLQHLLEAGGEVSCPDGRAGADVRRAIGTNSATMSETCKQLERDGLIVRDTGPRRTFRIALSEAGMTAAATVDDAAPVHPDTMGHRFTELAQRLGLRTPSGKRYGLHSLRHFRATHLYNASKDWVQVAKYLGHTSPIITMELYANNVVVPTQALLADAAAAVTPWPTD